jgi:hypothetical protein
MAKLILQFRYYFNKSVKNFQIKINFNYLNLQLNFHNFIIIIKIIVCKIYHVTFDHNAEDFLNKIK